MSAQISIAREAGACYGVERALQLTKDAAASGAHPVYTLGPLIHNPRVVAELEAESVRVAAGPSDAAGGTLILRTHGVTPSEEKQARELCEHVIDATCPFVKRCHKCAERLNRKGYQVVIVGEKGHPEVLGTLGHVPSALVVSSADEVAGLDPNLRVGVVVQTTQARANLDAVVAALQGRVAEVVVENTICEATSGHQSAAMELAREVDAMLVIGGKNSANTTHLAEVAALACENTHHIESEDELDPAWFEGVASIGITAGASTPASQIEAVRNAVEALVGDERGISPLVPCGTRGDIPLSSLSSPCTDSPSREELS